MRGKATHVVSDFRLSRITPAYAGKRFLLPSRFLLPRDHPRVCGEKAYVLRISLVTMGSPPRVRGKVILCGQDEVAVGITPAYAGKRPWLAAYCARCGDHPRVCGEKISGDCFFRPIVGSPPRVRGKVHVCHCSLVCCRITPACAGKRLSLFGKTYPEQDHPRVCGEK